MRKSWVLCLAVGIAGRLIADDGSWSDSRGFTPVEGPLYSEAGNPDISLDKEYLELTDFKSGATKAVFQFSNHAASPVSVECAFPVTIRWHGWAAQASEADSQPGWYFPWGPAGKEGERRGPFTASIGDWLETLGVKFSTQTFEDDERQQSFSEHFIAREDYPTGRHEVPAEPLQERLGLTIHQDGASVPIESCVVDYGPEPGVIVLHFRHKLAFAGGATSRVTVDYAVPGGDRAEGAAWKPGHTDVYTWQYVLETGSSWRGPIGTLVLAIPPQYGGELPSPLASVGAVDGRLLFRAVNWEPTSQQNLELVWSEEVEEPEALRSLWRTAVLGTSLESETRTQEGLQVGVASSFVPDKADVYVERGVLRQVDFGPARLFDGLRETAWAEGKPGDGVGESVSFAIDRSMCLVLVQNGYLRSTIDFPDKATWSYFDRNNRVKTLKLLHEDGQTAAVLPLADTRELQSFAVDLAPGSYRAVIAEVYRGTQWPDTCLGELTFVAGSSSGLAELRTDPFYSGFVTLR